MCTILQITPFYSPHLGGMERVAENLALGLGERHDVRVLTTLIGAGSAPRKSRQGRVTIRRHRTMKMVHTPLAPGILISLLRQPRNAVVHLHALPVWLPELVA